MAVTRVGFLNADKETRRLNDTENIMQTYCEFAKAIPFKVAHSCDPRCTIGNSAMCTFKLPYGLSTTCTASRTQVRFSLTANGTGAGMPFSNGHSISQPRPVMYDGGAPGDQIGDESGSSG